MVGPLPLPSRVARRLAALAGSIALLLPVAAFAHSLSVSPHSSYRGRTRQGLVVSLGPVRSRLRAFRYQARMACSDGTTFTDDAFTDTVTIVHNRFSAHVSTSSGAVVTRVTGRLGPNTATGTIRIIERYSEIPDPSGNTPLDPNGGILCDSGTVRWTARTR